MGGLSEIKAGMVNDLSLWENSYALGFPSEPDGLAGLAVSYYQFASLLTNFKQGEKYLEATGLVGAAMSGGVVVGQEGKVLGIIHGYEPQPQNLVRGQKVTAYIEPIPADFASRYENFITRVG